MNLDKTKKVLSQAFVDNCAEINEDEASVQLVQCEMRIREINAEMKADEKLMQTRELVKTLASSYNEAKKYERYKISYLLEKIQEIRDGEVNPTSGANDPTPSGETRAIRRKK